MESSTVIPRPWPHRLHDLRLRALPSVVFAAGVVLATFLWNKNWRPTSFVGEAQARSANVAAPQVGVLEEVLVEPFAPVRQGQVLAIVRMTSADTLRASLGAIRADLEVMRARMTQDQVRNQQNADALRLDWLSQRVDLAAARANLRYAENELSRMERLFRAQVTSESELDIARDRRDALLAEVEERARLVAEMEQAAASPSSAQNPADSPLILNTIDAAISAQEAQLRQTDGPIKLEAPLDGMVATVYRQAGETILAGEPLIAITAERPDHILGFIRQPISFQPKKGDAVEVRTRGNVRQVGVTQISAVGSRLELFSQPLRVRGFDSSLERGLPVLLDIPADMQLHPGELVDLFLKSDN
jgi:multidrug resistance efflux pump